MWNFDMDELRAEAAKLDDDGNVLKRPAPQHLPAVPESGSGPGSGPGSRPLSPSHSQPNSGRSSPRQVDREKSVEQRGRFTVIDDENAGGEKSDAGQGMDGSGGLTRTASSVQKGRFTVMDDENTKLPGGVTKKGSASSMIIGASEPDPASVATAAKAAAAAGRDLDPPRLKMRGLYELGQAAADLATKLKERHEDMEDEEKKITQLVEDNRWLRRRVAELEQMVGEMNERNQ
jgi:hypothetical protein